jgi:hypothetical protein
VIGILGIGGLCPLSGQADLPRGFRPREGNGRAIAKALKFLDHGETVSDDVRNPSRAAADLILELRFSCNERGGSVECIVCIKVVARGIRKGVSLSNKLRTTHLACFRDHSLQSEGAKVEIATCSGSCANPPFDSKSFSSGLAIAPFRVSVSGVRAKRGEIQMKRNFLFALFVAIAGGACAQKHAATPIVEVGFDYSLVHATSASGSAEFHDSWHLGRSGMAQAIETGIERLGYWWCKFIHDAPTWPIHRQYECRTCGRHHPVIW